MMKVFDMFNALNAFNRSTCFQGFPAVDIGKLTLPCSPQCRSQHVSIGVQGGARTEAPKYWSNRLQTECIPWVRSRHVATGSDNMPSAPTLALELQALAN